MAYDDEGFDFGAALSEKFAAKGLTKEPVTASEPEETPEPEAEVEEAPAGRERDERGRFVKAEVEDDEPDVAGDDDFDVEAADDLEEEPEERLYAGKYKTADELEKAYAELQALEGRRGNELGDLRKEIEQLRNEMYEDDVQDFPVMDAQASSYINTLVEQERWQEAAALAAQADPTGIQYQRVMKDWVEISPFEAMDFSTRLAVARSEVTLREEIARNQAAEQSRTAKDNFKGAWTSVTREFRDLGDYAEQMLEAAQTNPALARALEQGTQESMETTLRSLYWMSKGRQAGTPSDIGAAAVEAAAEKTAKKKKAAVASASSAPTARPKKSAKQRFKEEIVQAPLTSIEAGLAWREPE